MLKTIAQTRKPKATATAPAANPATTKERIVEAAFETLREVGYSGASARAIAKTGGFNQALIFYHFGGVDEALLAALDRSAEARLARYRETFDPIDDLRQMVDASYALFKEDAATGHVKVLAELVAAGASNPELGAKVVKRVEPSLAFTSATFDRLMAGSPLATFVKSRDAAYALAALYLGMELMSLLEGSGDRTESLFTMLGSAASLMTMLSGSGSAE